MRVCCDNWIPQDLPQPRTSHYADLEQNAILEMKQPVKMMYTAPIKYLNTYKWSDLSEPEIVCKKIIN